MVIVGEDPTRLAEVADILLTIHQCELRTYRYMAHVMLAAQQAHHMRLAMAQMGSDTAYMNLIGGPRGPWPPPPPKRDDVVRKIYYHVRMYVLTTCIDSARALVVRQRTRAM